MYFPTRRRGLPTSMVTVSDTQTGASYVYGNGLEMRIVNGVTQYFVTDCRGSVVAIVDDSGNITHKYQYDEFGKVIQSKEADFNPFRYVGKWGVMYNTDTHYYMRARHYDPTIGRFLSEDPIWSTNLYPYADNNPIMGIDPEGKAYVKTRQLYVHDNPNEDRIAYNITENLLLSDYLNIQLLHEQIFFESGVIIPGYNNNEPIYNIGFGADLDNEGNIVPIINEPENLYGDVIEYLPEDLTIQAVSENLPSDFGQYNQFNHNCQTYVDTIRKIVNDDSFLKRYFKKQIVRQINKGIKYVMNKIEEK